MEFFKGIEVSACYQCGKCSAGCPVNFAMDILPHQVVRFLQLEETDRVLASEAIWLCTFCSTCASRCPRGVDLPALIEELRRSARDALSEQGRRQRAFHFSILRSLERHGRVYPVGVALAGSLRAKQMTGDASLVWELLRRGRLQLCPSRVRGRPQIRRFFRRAWLEQGGKKHA